MQRSGNWSSEQSTRVHRPPRRLAFVALTTMTLLFTACSRESDRAEPPATPVTDVMTQPLTSQPGDPHRGEFVFHSRDTGHCLLCHSLALSTAPFQGDIAPALDGVAQRLSAAQIRLRIVDMARINPNTVMPPYFRATKLRQVSNEFEGRTVLTAQEVEDVVAYLMTLNDD